MKGKLIFIVDDDPIVNMLVVNKFTSEGFRVEAFQNGEDCLKAINKDPDLIILDYFFANTESKKALNGMEILDRLKLMNPALPVIMLSGQENGEVVLELARKGVDDYIIKDKDVIGNLHTAIDELIGGH